MSKTPIPIKPIDFDLARRAVDELAAERNVPTQVYPKELAVADRPDGKGRGGVPVKLEAPRAPSSKFTVVLPNYVIDAIQARTIQAKPKRTARYVVLEALRAVGIPVDEADMVFDGRRTSGHP